jgi:hypothetical protein
MDRDPASVLDIVLACRRLKGFVVGRSREDLDRGGRTNIPTEELRRFVADDEQAPKTMLYPSDPVPELRLGE